MMQVLVIAPEIEGLPRLAQTSELTRLGDVSGLVVHPLTGPLVTPERIQQRLRGQRYDVALWSGHGKAGRLLLPNNREVEPRWLASELKQSGVTVLVLSVCDSSQRHIVNMDGFSDAIPSAGIHLVAMPAAIGDKSAVDYDVALLHALAGGETIRDAHRIGLDALNEQEDAQPQLFMSDTANVNDLARRMDQLRSAMHNGRSEDALSIIQQCKTILGDLEDHYKDLDDRVAIIEHKLNPPWQVRLWQAASATVILVAMSLLFIYQARELLFTPWYVGASFEIILLALAVMCWRMATVTLEKLR